MRGNAGTVLQTLKQHGDLRLADGGNDSLPGLLVALHLEGGIGVGTLLQEGIELALGTALVGLDGDAIQAVWEAEGSSLHLAGDGERVTSEGIELRHDHDVACGSALYVGSLATRHDVEMAQTLGLARTSIYKLQTSLHRTAEHLDKRKLAVLRIVEALKHEGYGALVFGIDVELLAVDQRNAAKIGHGREPRHDCVHEGDNALLLYARTGKDGYEDALADGGREAVFDVFLSDFLALEVGHHHVVVCLGHEVHERLARLFCCVGVLRGDILLDDLAILEVTGLHVHDVDHAGKVCARTHRDGHGTEVVSKALLAEIERGLEVGLGLVQAIDEDGTGQRKVLCCKPKTRGGGLRAINGVHHKERRLRCAHCRIGIAYKVGIAGGIKNVDARAVPLHGSHGSGDGEAASALLRIVVQRGLGAGVATQTGRLARKVQHGLCQHGLAHATLAYQNHILYCLFFCCHMSLLIYRL